MPISFVGWHAFRMMPFTLCKVLHRQGSYCIQFCSAANLMLQGTLPTLLKAINCNLGGLGTQACLSSQVCMHPPQHKRLCEIMWNRRREWWQVSYEWTRLSTKKLCFRLLPHNSRKGGNSGWKCTRTDTHTCMPNRATEIPTVQKKQPGKAHTWHNANWNCRKLCQQDVPYNPAPVKQMREESESRWNIALSHLTLCVHYTQLASRTLASRLRVARQFQLAPPKASLSHTPDHKEYSPLVKVAPIHSHNNNKQNNKH